MSGRGARGLKGVVTEGVDADPGTALRSTRRAVRRRLAPLYAAAFLQNVALWVPIEKLFMTSIGFDAAWVGVMAAVYSVAVPVFELPSGILADRWSRRGVMVLACLAAMVSVTIGGLSQNVATYIVAAFFLGIFFAMQSGTFESVVYDTVLEESGSSDDFARVIGRIRLTESVGLVASALVGGVVAELVSLRSTYFLTLPFLVAACVAVLVFREPTLHEAEEGISLREQVATTYRTLARPGTLRAVIALTVAAALVMQGMFEFGPLWLVALSVAAVWYGPHWAGLTAALGVGGMLGTLRQLTTRWAAAVLAVVLVGCSVVLVVSSVVAVVVVAQVVLVAVVVAVGIPVMRRLHDSVPSTIRAGVASGVGTLTWLAFVPFALAVGFLGDRVGVAESGWLFVAVAVVCGVLFAVVLPRAPAPTPAALDEAAAATRVTAFPADRFLPDDHPEWPGHWAVPPEEWTGLSDAAADAAAVVRDALLAMPPELRRVMVLRDVQGRGPGTAARELGIGAEEEQQRLHSARSLVRARLADWIEERRRASEHSPPRRD